jgi:acylphosphatase
MQREQLPEQIRVHVFVSGRVQGVGYRMSTYDTATDLGINGWVRNLPDDRVEAVFEGNKEVVEAMVRWCHQGPSLAVVKDIAVESEEPEGIQGFRITR